MKTLLVVAMLLATTAFQNTGNLLAADKSKDPKTPQSIGIEDVILAVRRDILNAQKKAEEEFPTKTPVFTGQTFELELKFGVQRRKTGGGGVDFFIFRLGGEKVKQIEQVQTIKLTFSMNAPITTMASQ